MLDVRDKMFYSDVSVMWKPSPLEDCISFMASTTDKMNARFQSIKEEFPNAEFVELDEASSYLEDLIEAFKIFTKRSGSFSRSFPVKSKTSKSL